MLKTAKKILEKINDYNYQAYIVGGYVRDYLLNIESNDIDITTNATPKQLQEIFNEVDLSSEEYGSVTLRTDNIRFEITTFRKEMGYVDNRRPMKIEYINNLEQDLLRRDFTINTICMDKDEKIIDPLGGRIDLNNKIIKSVGNPQTKFEEDSLRILRAVRFAAYLNFELDNAIIEAIEKTKHLLKNISYNRKKEELDKIFSHENVQKGIDLLLKFGLDKELELDRLKDVKNTDSLISVWSVLNVVDIYPFSNNEKELITNINKVLTLNNFDPRVLYEYGLYVNSVAGAIKGIDRKLITKKYDNLVIKSKKDIDISSEDIMEILKKEPGKYLSEIYNDIEEKILYNNLDNNKDSITKYILSKY